MKSSSKYSSTSTQEVSIIVFGFSIKNLFWDIPKITNSSRFGKPGQEDFKEQHEVKYSGEV